MCRYNTFFISSNTRLDLTPRHFRVVTERDGLENSMLDRSQ